MKILNMYYFKVNLNEWWGIIGLLTKMYVCTLSPTNFLFMLRATWATYYFKIIY